METRELIKKIENLQSTLKDLKTKLEISGKEMIISELTVKTKSVDFWNNVEEAQKIMTELNNLKMIVENYEELSSSCNTILELLHMELDESEFNDLIMETNYLESKVNELKLATFLNGKYDSSNAYIEIHSGAGGTESNDWANMIYRMYVRFFERNNYKYEVISKNDGEEVGIKGIVLLVKGYYPFGYLKGETGVHRLVRISPFDSNSRRHTSFASVLVTPQIEKNISVEIKESDLKIDVYRSSGAGGQGVNTTDSAVRITHLPTGIVTSCQIERSQIKNKERALEMLKSKLFLMNQNEFNSKIKELKGDVMDVNFGSAIRSYVMCPYTLVKDNRTNYETSSVDKILDGDIKELLEEYLKI